MRAGVVSDSVASSWDPFPLTRLPRPALILFVPGLPVAYYTVFVSPQWGNGGRVDQGKWGGLGEGKLKSGCDTRENNNK